MTTQRLCWIIVCGVVGMTLSAGCAWGPSEQGDLTVRSLSHADRLLRGNFTRAYYSAASKSELIIVLLAGEPEKPEQAMTVRMFWRPRAGSTPIGPDATNATVQYIVFAEGADQDQAQVGIYSGAGFLFPRNKPGQQLLDAGLWEANLQLQDASPGFQDLLGQATLEGDLIARHDDEAVSELLHHLNAMVTERLQYPRLVDAGPMH